MFLRRALERGVEPAQATASRAIHDIVFESRKRPTHPMQVRGVPEPCALFAH
jgi:hypothetical protein